MKISISLYVVLLVATSGGAINTNGLDFEITRWTIDAGGVMWSAGGDFELSGSIGQPDAGVMNGGALELSGGFWSPLSPDDCNNDGWVDLVDYENLANCLSGPSDAFALARCNCFDLDGDNDVDLDDVRRFQGAFNRE